MTETDRDINTLKTFENQKIRTAWDEETEERYFSISDVVSVLTEQDSARSAAKYWSVLKIRLNSEGFEMLTNCKQLKMKAADSKMILQEA